MTRKILYLVTAIFFLAFCWVIYNLVHFNTNRQEAAVEMGTETTQVLQEDVNTILLDVMKGGERFASLLENNTFTKDTLNQEIIKASNELDQVLGITVAYEPYALNEENRLYAPYYDKGKKEILYLGESYDYTDPSLSTTTWYTSAVQQGKVWVEPYYGQVAQNYFADYSVPFYFTEGARKGELQGVVCMSISLEGFTSIIHSLSLGKTGYGFVTSPKGKIIAHPVTAYMGTKTVNQLKTEETRPLVQGAYQELLDGNTGNIEFYDDLKQQETLFFYDRVPASNWRIGVLFFKNDLLGGENILKRKYINIALVGSLLLFFVLAVFYNRDYLSEREIWYLGFFAGFVLLGNILFVGYLQHTAIHTKEDLTESPPVSDVNTLSSIVNEQAQEALDVGKIPKIVIPTGVYIDRLFFEDSYNVSVSGQIWQKYPNTIVDSVTTGFALPQTAPFAEAQLLEERGRQQGDEYTIITYAFRNTFRLNFQYKKYPFDRRNIKLYIQPLSLKDNLIFVPDLESYAFTNPSQCPGISKKIELSGSEILESYFSYNYYTYDATFGSPISGSNTPVAEMYYNVKLKRVLITAFVTYLIPIFVTLIMMFMLIYTIKKEEDKKVDGNIVQAMTAFFFVLIFSHIDLRKNIDTAELIYMEYFYFVTYVMIILSTYNLITYSRDKNHLFDYKENLIVKTTFWPVFLMMILIITLLMFY